ncbi:hypothetical protein N7468_004705 [Penicillium chermesinum]|uniref:DNA-directed RNA polymerase III subunit RPC9 n=1 Tax=Penicillium chermesinum TaxID=63820 RepID=A0A9W9P9P6_9EURO|nr:uncharacterized protein N7468_004705 [Penicillium chermesinum]KAJ5240086.1 hypothetical protein N7468_004705 [Penicillium chermesinum]
MRIIDPQSAVLTNVEIHNYVSRISPHLLRYPRFNARPSSSVSHSRDAMTGTFRSAANPNDTQLQLPPSVSTELTPMDHAIRELITRLKPYKLTKAEVVMILNLGVGLNAPSTGEGDGVEEEDLANGESIMEVDQENGHVNGEAEGGEGEEEDQGALALFESVVEERESRLTEAQVSEILAIVREVLAENVEA